MIRRSAFLAAITAFRGAMPVFVGLLVGALFLASCGGGDVDLPSDDEYPALAELSEEFGSTADRIGVIAGEPDEFEEWAVTYCWNLFASVRISPREGPAPPAEYRGTAQARWSGLSPTQIDEAIGVFTEHLESLGFDTSRSGPYISADVFPSSTSAVFPGHLNVSHYIEGRWGGQPGDIYLAAATPCYTLAELNAGMHDLPADPGQN